jgi:hypothetical protein
VLHEACFTATSAATNPGELRGAAVGVIEGDATALHG